MKLENVTSYNLANLRSSYVRDYAPVNQVEVPWPPLMVTLFSCKITCFK